MSGAGKAISATLITDTGDASLLVKYLKDSIPLGEHQNPHAEHILVRLDVIQGSIDHIQWLEKGNEEWRQMFATSIRHAEAARATARVAIGHLQAVLNKAGTHDEQQKADTAARDWLTSIGSAPD